jgi:hypothetical protein
MNTEHLLLSLGLSLLFIVLTNANLIISHTLVGLILIELVDHANVTNMRTILDYLRDMYNKNVELCMEKYNNYQKLMILIHTIDDLFRVFVFGCKVLYGYGNDYITTYIKKSTNNIPTRLQGKLYSIDFLHRGKIFKAILPIKGVAFSRIVSISVDDDDKKSHELLQYMGPDEDFYKIKVSPSTFGYNKVNVCVRDEDLNTTEYSFMKDEPIVF